MTDEFIKQLVEEFDGSLEHLRVELVKIHTGRASTGLIEDLKIDYYGSYTPLKALASITIAAPREIKIEVWDQNAVKSVSDALAKASLGSLPQIEDRVIRINLPPMTSETREKMVKRVQEVLEEAKISLRSHREKIWNEIQKLEHEGNIREDEKFRLKNKIQENIDEYNKKIDELGGKKEEEVRA